MLFLQAPQKGMGKANQTDNDTDAAAFDYPVTAPQYIDPREKMLQRPLITADVSCEKVEHPSKTHQIGDEGTFRLLNFDRQKKRVSIGIK